METSRREIEKKQEQDEKKIWADKINPRVDSLINEDPFSMKYNSYIKTYEKEIKLFEEAVDELKSLLIMQAKKDFPALESEKDFFHNLDKRFPNFTMDLAMEFPDCYDLTLEKQFNVFYPTFLKNATSVNSSKEKLLSSRIKTVLNVADPEIRKELAKSINLLPAIYYLEKAMAQLKDYRTDVNTKYTNYVSLTLRKKLSNAIIEKELTPKEKEILAEKDKENSMVKKNKLKNKTLKTKQEAQASGFHVNKFSLLKRAFTQKISNTSSYEKAANTALEGYPEMIAKTAGILVDTYNFISGSSGYYDLSVTSGKKNELPRMDMIHPPLPTDLANTAKMQFELEKQEKEITETTLKAVEKAASAPEMADEIAIIGRRMKRSDSVDSLFSTNSTHGSIDSTRGSIGSRRSSIESGSSRRNSLNPVATTTSLPGVTALSTIVSAVAPEETPLAPGITVEDEKEITQRLRSNSQ